MGLTYIIIILYKLIFLKSFFSIFVLNKLFVIVLIMMMYFLWFQIDILQAITLFYSIQTNRILDFRRLHIVFIKIKKYKYIFHNQFGNNLSIHILLNLHIIFIIVKNVMLNRREGFSFQIFPRLINCQIILIIIICFCLINLWMLPIFNDMLYLLVPRKINWFAASYICL